MAEADAEIRPLHLFYPALNGGLLREEPRMDIDLPDIHRAAHDDHEIVGRKVRDGIASVDFHRIVGVACLRPELTKDAGMFDRHVLEDQYFHHEPTPGLSRDGTPIVVEYSK